MNTPRTPKRGAQRNEKPTRKTPVKVVKAKSPSSTTGSEAPKEVSSRDKRKYIDYKIKVKKGDPLPSFNDDAIRLNKYLANAGICSRREADVLIQTGVVSINNVIVTELGYKNW